MTKEEVLKNYFGYDHFRPLQAEIIEKVLQNEDCLVLMPTGGGKSLCYQVPALLKEGIGLVVSPLIALMQDQVQALRAQGVEAVFLNSTQSSQEQLASMQDCRKGKIKILYVSPEKLFSAGFLDFLENLQVNLFAVDESHCVSFWGHDFRPEYTQLKILKTRFPHIPVIALTATADRSTRRDILEQLGITEAQVFIASFDRPNLSLQVAPGRKKIEQILQFLKYHQGSSGIIYCLSRNATEQLAERLQAAGLRAECYHAGLPADTRRTVQERFLKDDIQIIVATIAFGMGIDKSNIRWVIHYNLPKNIENFYQEIGRAGRDGATADTLLFYSYADVMAQMKFHEELSAERRELMDAKLQRMRQYAEAEICRRRILLSYFNEVPEQDCGNCDVCKNPKKKFEATVLAQKALSAVARAKEEVAVGLLVDILRGARNKQVLAKGYQELKTFGVGKELRTEEWAEYIWQMVNMGLLEVRYDEKHNLKLSPLAWQVLRGERQVLLSKFVPFEERQAKAQEEQPRSTKDRANELLLERLKKLRSRLAAAEGVPPYIVFSDATLQEMVLQKPLYQSALLSIQGVGQRKMEAYGQHFLQEIFAFIEEGTFQSQSLGIDSAQITYAYYLQGLSPEHIAEKRTLTPTTVYAHLTKLYEQGSPINLRQYLAIETQEEILQAARRLGVNKSSALKALYEHLGGRYEYHHLRLALALGG